MRSYAQLKFLQHGAYDDLRFYRTVLKVYIYLNTSENEDFSSNEE